MTSLNQALTWLADLAFAPIDRLPPLVGLAVLSLVTAIGVLLAFKWTADQQGLAAAKRAMQAAVFEMRLLNDDLVALFRAQGDVLRHTGRYLRLSFAPTVWLLVPMALLMIHMEFHYGYTGLRVGQAALVKARLQGGAAAAGGAATPAAAAATIEAPNGITVETPAVYLPSVPEVAWRIRPARVGTYELRVQLAGMVVTKAVVVSEAIARRSPVKPSGGAWAQALNPSERPLPADSGLESIAVDYPARPFEIAGLDVGWAGVYLALTLVFAFALRGVFGVTM